ncbi:sensor histidine kinase [Maribacter chungangensis]|uniref:histidine kinase n=1 Tax=Maribacter chungangensis TaxID=1069117 RepID=A0ABW3B063_9FLAO
MIFFSSSLWSNTKVLEEFFNATKNQDYDRAFLIASQIDDEVLENHLTSLATLLAVRPDASSHTITIESKADDQLNFIKYLILGYQHNYASNQDNLAAFKCFTNALKLAQKTKNKVYTKAALLGILDLFVSEIFIGSKQFQPFLELFIDLKTDRTDDFLILLYNLIFFTKADDSLDDIDAQYYAYYNKLDSIVTEFPSTHTFYPIYYFEKGIYHKIEQNYNKAVDLFLKADSLASKNKYANELRTKIAWQIASVHTENNNLDDAKRYLKMFKNGSGTLKDSFYNTRLASIIFQKENKYDSAYHYLRKSVDIEYQLGYKNNTLESSILTVQNQTDKLKLDKLELDAKNKKITNWATALATLLIIGSAFAFLINSNTKRKQLLAEQGKTLQEQKVATLLKEQELTTIDAIIEGQEKERQRIANELHDDLGGSMATIKLYFNSLQEKTTGDNEALFGKTNILLDEAYTKIRRIAHAKNSGVIAKQGLLKAVRQMGEKISAANSITITVKDFGLDNRLENSLELTLFRIIQELVTNVIKHAQATTLNIHLTNHGDTLNILIEDNGIGFDIHKNMALKKGMGLKSIDKRIAHLDGTLHIESDPGKGATVIIDIPL